jgi:hypothetical protein
MPCVPILFGVLGYLLCVFDADFFRYVTNHKFGIPFFLNVDL